MQGANSVSITRCYCADDAAAGAYPQAYPRWACSVKLMLFGGAKLPLASSLVCITLRYNLMMQWKGWSYAMADAVVLAPMLDYSYCRNYLTPLSLLRVLPQMTCPP